ncbi:MAG: adenosine kinase [Candidatus Aenigmatarchaeota archaeon]|nr:MAG: adenosine kinase [Candidatus Aenigmarchaeota archaeon]
MAFDVFGFGNVLVDILIQIDDSHIAELDLKKGNFHLAGPGKIRGLLEHFDHQEKKIVPAGSSANTIFALSSLGSDVVLCGKIGEDPHGKMYEDIVLENRIRSRIKRSDVKGTGTVINLVTPDGERTFVVDLGASVTLNRDELHDVLDDLTDSKFMHTEAYVIENPLLRESALHLMDEAKKNGVRISLDLSDPGVIERNLEDLKKIVKDYADIVFFNEDEAKIFTGLGPEEALREISKLCGIAVVKLGASGSLIKPKDSDDIIRIDALKANAVDTTGAGDFYAAGFLYGLSRKKDIKTCGTIGSIIAGKVVEQFGARPPENLRYIPELKGLL